MNMKYVTRILTILFIGALLSSCDNVLEPNVSKQGGQILSAGNGLVQVQIGAAEGARTIMPSTPAFSKYTVVFSVSGKTDITVTIEDPVTTVTQELTVETWNVAVTAYMKFTPTGGSETEYAAATGSGSVTVTADATTPVTVSLTPQSITGSGVPNGIFTYKVTYPSEGVTAALTVKDSSGTPVSGLNGVTPGVGTEVSTVLSPGYYDLVISLTKAVGAGTHRRLLKTKTRVK
jgi:hypothetical protein